MHAVVSGSGLIHVTATTSLDAAVPGPGTITSTLRSVERPTELAWTGKTMGISAVHVWRFETRSGKTLVRTEESWEGALVRLLRGRMGKMLQEDVDASMPLLRAEAERRASRPTAPPS